tara:strand:+ start:656 stop:1084 length:429 start_codon:yes stop_codon:yes gene_type:complete
MEINDINLTAYERYNSKTDTFRNTPESPRATRNKPRSSTPEPKRKKTRSSGKKTERKRKGKGKGKGKSNTLVNKFYMDTIDNPPIISSLDKSGIQLWEDNSYAPGVTPRIESKNRITRRVIIKNPKTKTKSKGKKSQKKRKH